MVVLTNELDRDRIAHQQQLEKLRTLEALLPAGVMTTIWWPGRLVTSREYLGSDQPMPPLHRHPQGGAHRLRAGNRGPDGYSGAIRMVVGTATDAISASQRVLATRKPRAWRQDRTEISWIESFAASSLTAKQRGHLGGERMAANSTPSPGRHYHPRAVVQAVKNLLLLQQGTELL